MGYTHSWGNRDPEAWATAFPLIVHDTHIIISHSGVPIGGPNPEGQGPVAPTVSETDGIALNGDKGAFHEPFKLMRDVKQHRKHQRFQFCKTARKPYDRVVTAILLRAKVHAGDALIVSSDGNWDEWKGGRDFVERLWGEECVFCPFDKPESDKEDQDQLERMVEGAAAAEGVEVDDKGA